jgi:hypothetical protein
MASAQYKRVTLYLHKDRDKDLLAYLEGLPPWLRQAYMREAIQAYRDTRLSGASSVPRAAINTAGLPVRKASPKFGDTQEVNPGE